MRINISEIKPNPDNPRTISKEKFEALKKSIQDFPQMLLLRPLIIDGNNIVLGGNMRLKALQELGIKEVEVLRADDLTEKQKREFIIRDNISFGTDDWDVLSDWDESELKEWGMDLPVMEISSDNFEGEKSRENSFLVEFIKLKQKVIQSFIKKGHDEQEAIKEAETIILNKVAELL